MLALELALAFAAAAAHLSSLPQLRTLPLNSLLAS